MNIGVCGLGRAGKEMVRMIMKLKEDQLVMAVCREESSTAGRELGELLELPEIGVTIIKLSEIREYSKYVKVDVIIDFSHPSTSLKLADICKELGIHLVICTTNFDEKEQCRLREIGNLGTIGMVYAPNLTIGINLLMEFVEKISRILIDFDFEIIERHGKSKPRPTTTARLISNVINRGDTPISSIRVGGYVGVHEVTAASDYERISIIHESFSRQAFANGALIAAKFIVDKKGLYGMQEVIGNLEEKLIH